MIDADAAIALVFARNDYYRRRYFLALAIFGVSILVIITLICVLIFLKRNPPQPLYFATDNIGRLIEVVPTDQLSMEQDQVIAWTKEAVQAAYSYDFINYREQLQSAQKYFTNYGWTKYLDALKASNNLVSLTERKLVVEARVIGEPTLITQGLLGGSLAWKFRMPLLVSYLLPPYDAQSKFSNPLTVTVIVQRQPILQSYKGLGIIQIIGAMGAPG